MRGNDRGGRLISGQKRKVRLAKWLPHSCHPRVCCQPAEHPRISPRCRREHTMAEGLVGGVLGGEDDKPEVEAPEAVPGAEAFAAAVAAKLAGNDPGVARKTEEVLRDQSHLLNIPARELP